MLQRTGKGKNYNTWKFTYDGGTTVTDKYAEDLHFQCINSNTKNVNEIEITRSSFSISTMIMRIIIYF